MNTTPLNPSTYYCELCEKTHRSHGQLYKQHLEHQVRQPRQRGIKLEGALKVRHQRRTRSIQQLEKMIEEKKVVVEKEGVQLAFTPEEASKLLLEAWIEVEELEDIEKHRDNLMNQYQQLEAKNRGVEIQFEKLEEQLGELLEINRQSVQTLEEVKTACEFYKTRAGKLDRKSVV